MDKDGFKMVSISSSKVRDLIQRPGFSYLDKLVLYYHTERDEFKVRVKSSVMEKLFHLQSLPLSLLCVGPSGTLEDTKRVFLGERSQSLFYADTGPEAVVFHNLKSLVI